MGPPAASRNHMLSRSALILLTPLHNFNTKTEVSLNTLEGPITANTELEAGSHLVSFPRLTPCRLQAPSTANLDLTVSLEEIIKLFGPSFCPKSPRSQVEGRNRWSVACKLIPAQTNRCRDCGCAFQLQPLTQTLTFELATNHLDSGPLPCSSLI